MVSRRLAAGVKFAACYRDDWQRASRRHYGASRTSSALGCYRAPGITLLRMRGERRGGEKLHPLLLNAIDRFARGERSPLPLKRRLFLARSRHGPMAKPVHQKTRGPKPRSVSRTSLPSPRQYRPHQSLKLSRMLNGRRSAGLKARRIAKEARAGKTELDKKPTPKKGRVTR